MTGNKYLKCSACGAEYPAAEKDTEGMAVCYMCKKECWFDIVVPQETDLCVKCHKRPSYNGNWCDRCEMADRAWQVEVWDKHRISNADAIYVYGFKSRVDMEEAWYEAGLADREARYKYQIK